MTSLNYLSQNVFDAAKERIGFCFDHCDDIIVSMSGGKDSTVMFELALAVARQRGRLPLKVYWLDQEAEWIATEAYMRGVMYRPEVEPWWFQIPFRLTNSLSFTKNYLHVWSPDEKDRWLRDQDPVSVKVNPTGHDRFHEVVARCPSYCGVDGRRHVGVLVGMRIQESLARRMILMYRTADYHGITWCRKFPVRNTRVFWPIYDMRDTDVWTAIANEHWAYNSIYDRMYQAGVRKMRVSALIHETSWHAIRNLHEFEPRLYDRYLARVNGVNCFDHFDTELIPRQLPPYFRDWREYRDYLLLHLIEVRHHDTFRSRWKGQDSIEHYKLHVHEIMVNDIDGTVNDNGRIRMKKDALVKSGYYRDRALAKYAKLIEQLPQTEVKGSE
jgi:predicted phosphoadenosine phosphosulfate sulfurtransferase